MKPLTPPTSLTNASDQLLRNESDRGFTRIYQAVNQINQSVGQFADGEIPTPTPTDGTNKVFTLSQSPAPVSSLKVFLAGALLSPKTAYSLRDNVITFTAAPAASADLFCWYRYQ